MPGIAAHEPVQDQKQQPHRRTLQQHSADDASRDLTDDPVLSSRPKHCRTDGSAFDLMQRLGRKGQRRQGGQGQQADPPCTDT